MERNDCLRLIQTFLENGPLIILGSGASASHGLPLMSEICDELHRHSDKFDADEFNALCGNLSTMNLEEAIDNSSLSTATLENLRRIIWHYINRKDLELFYKITRDEIEFSLADLLELVIRPTPNTATIVTTNYDRLPEYAADQIGATTVTGFEGSLIRRMIPQNSTLQRKRIQARERVVNIWKVHGSLDWFSKCCGEIISYPLLQEVPDEHSPLIIAPGKGKYNLTHSEPYREVIAQADRAFSNANSFLCVGYGFNDDHIQPKLIEQINKGKPIVVLSYEATEACLRKIVSAGVKKYIIIECYSKGRTLVTGNGYKEVYEGDFWSLPSFINTVY